MRFQIEHRIGVRAPASEVWRELAAVESWPDWAPMYPQASGRLQIGGVLTLTEAVPGEPPQPITPSIVDWVPNAQIVWTRTMWGGLVRRTRYLEIQVLTEQGSVFSNGEMFEGRAARFVPRRLRRALKAGFAGVGEAMKARVESAGVESAGVEGVGGEAAASSEPGAGS